MSTASQRLAHLLLERQAQPFAWGVRDCVTLPFDAVQALTGRDLLADVRGRYRTASSALRVLRQLGGLRALCDTRLAALPGAEDRRDGDVALLRPDVCTGAAAAHGALGVAWAGDVVAQGGDGLVRVPASAALAWWRAG